VRHELEIESPRRRRNHSRGKKMRGGCQGESIINKKEGMEFHNTKGVE